MKLIPAVILAASIGTCSVGGQQRLPPSPAEQEAASAARTAPDTPPADPWAGLPAECRELAVPCDACEEVERMRRKIEFKKCMPVCDAYLERTEVMSEVPADAISLLQGPNACGKSDVSCSPIEQTRCEYIIGYVSAGVLFRAHWRDKTDPGASGLARQFHAEFLTPYLDHHGRVASWARSNELDPAPLLRLGGDLLGVTATEMITEVTTQLGADADPLLPAISSLVELSRFPGDPASFGERRGTAEASLEP